MPQRPAQASVTDAACPDPDGIPDGMPDGMPHGLPGEVPGVLIDAPAPRLAGSRVDALWQRILLPLRPRSWRYSAGLLVVGVVLCVAPWHLLRHPFGVRAAAATSGWREKPRDWVALAAGVESPGGFRPFEPVLEELTGAAPLTFHRVTFHSEPRGSAGEVGSYAGRRIDLYGTAPYDRKDHAYLCPEVRVCGAIDLCRGADAPPRTDWIRGRNVARWVHEQGHFYEGFPRGWGQDTVRHWVSETAATALVFAFAEHLGRGYSPELGANLLLSQLVTVEGNTHFELSPASRRDLRRAFDDLNDDDAALERLAAAAVLVLRASGLPSFGDVWRYAQERSPEEVVNRVRRFAGRLAAGFDLTVDLALQLEGRQGPLESSDRAPVVIDAAALGPLQGIAREECLEVWYQRYVLAFCGHGRDARLDVTTVESRRLVARLALQSREVCLLALGDAEAPATALVYEHGIASLRTTATMAAPCLCRAEETALPGATGRAALDRAASRLQTLVARALGDVDEAGAPVEREFAHEVVGRLAAALPPTAPEPPRRHARR